MSAVVAAVVPVLVGAAVLLGFAAFLATRHVTVGLAVLLDLLLAAGLLRLSAAASWQALATAAALVAVRKVANLGIGASQRARRSAVAV